MVCLLYLRYWVCVRLLRGLQGEDKPSPLLCYEQVATSSIARAAASFARTCARCKNRTHTLRYCFITVLLPSIAMLLFIATYHVYYWCVNLQLRDGCELVNFSLFGFLLSSLLAFVSQSV